MRRAPALGAAPRKRTWLDAAAELGRTLHATGNRDAADSVVEALASIGVDVELERPPAPPPKADWFATERDARVGAALHEPAQALVEDLAGRVVDEDGAAYRGALARLELEQLRGSLDGASLFSSSAEDHRDSSSSSPPAGAERRRS